MNSTVVPEILLMQVGVALILQHSGLVFLRCQQHLLYLAPGKIVIEVEQNWAVHTNIFCFVLKATLNIR